MADRLNVAERLAEGRPAVEHTQAYVRACQGLGYQHPDLTAHPAQLRDWYGSEDGLDLRALDSDCAELRAAAAAATEALRMQRAQVAVLDGAWTGPGADSAIWFLQRHCDAANVVAAELRAAAQRCESLRDNLWHLLDAKVTTVIDIDDRTQGHRSQWLAAADALTTGTGDRATAEELVRQQIIPYVDSDVRVEWLTAMRSTQAGVAASYDMVTDRFAAAPAASFEIPGDLGPSGHPFQPASPSPPATPAAAAAVAPVATLPTRAADPAPPAPAEQLPQPVPTQGALPADGAAMSPVGGGGLDGLGGLGELGGGGGLAGLANRIVEAMGDLLGSQADQSSDPSTLDGPLDPEEPFDDDPAEQADEAGKHRGTSAAEIKAPPANGTPHADLPPAAEPLVASQSPPPGQPPAGEMQPAPPSGVPPPTNGPPAAPAGASSPCEIAADELPQAGQ
ncbi:hypothetical protein A9W99_15410 [Mycobacterium sp. 1164966.3]|uniref:hypothetical protein n=1 Tax=Mycobacterium sp. 1164966.3 TaxID=1856861 RepID=UPI0007FB89BD|nr:hypothetical protein [Mycobacterium sp. 1164966.3]OBA80966.1 hypothetical protein A9W99_15410 [Mycobacterium sp. 1164966.3]